MFPLPTRLPLWEGDPGIILSLFQVLSIPGVLIAKTGTTNRVMFANEAENLPVPGHSVSFTFYDRHDIYF